MGGNIPHWCNYLSAALYQWQGIVDLQSSRLCKCSLILTIICAKCEIDDVPTGLAFHCFSWFRCGRWLSSACHDRVQPGKLGRRHSVGSTGLSWRTACVQLLWRLVSGELLSVATSYSMLATITYWLRFFTGSVGVGFLLVTYVRKNNHKKNFCAA